MTMEYKLPELGENVSSGTVARVLVAVGDSIVAGQNILEIETDKAVAEIPCSVSGKITEIRVREGQKINTGDVLLVLDESATPAASPETNPPPAPVDAPPADTAPPAAPAPAVATNAVPRPGAARATPSVRKLAREHDLDLNEVPTADPSGRITAQDVMAFVAARDRGDAAPVETPTAPAATSVGGTPADVVQGKWGAIAREPMNAIRIKASGHLTACWQNIPHVTHFDKADITELEKRRLQYAPAAERAGAKLTISAFLIKALAEALKRFPRFNASVDMENQQLLLKQYCHIGVAVDTPNGLVVPVIRDADRKSVVDIALEMSALAGKARDRKLTLEEMQGGCFTVSNLGGLGGHAFTPIINAPEVAILGVSRSQHEPVYLDGAFVPRLMLPLSLSYDHRIIDGADAARFARFLAESLEDPWRMMLGA